MPDNELTRYFLNLIRQVGSYDIAQAEFQRMIADDDELREAYRAWCDEQGYAERTGFKIFCDECIAIQNSAMDSLNDEDF